MINIFTNISDTINNSKFLTVVVTSFIIMLGLCFIAYIIKLLSNIRMYIVNKSNSFYLANLKNQTKDNSTLDMPSRIDLTNSILDLITFLINNEIIIQIKPYIVLNNPYEISRLDDDVRVISTNVFKSINPSLFKDTNLVLTDEYLMTYITKKSMGLMIDVVQNHNDTIRGQNKQSTED